MNNSLSVTDDLLEKISKTTNNKYTPGIIRTLIKTSFPTLKTPEQAVVAFQTAQQYDLDPKMKEMFAWVDNKGRMICIASAMGFMKIARKQPGFEKIESHAVYEGEEFEMNTGTGEVSHKINPSKRAGKKPLGAYAILKMKGKESQVKRANWSDYYTKKKFDSAWDKQGDVMIEKCASTVLLRQAFGLSGLYGEEETDGMRDINKGVTTGDFDKKSTMNAMEKRESEMNSDKEAHVEIIDPEDD